MQKAFLYIHGKCGSSKETEQFKPYCNGYNIYGIDFEDFTPWGTKNLIESTFDQLQKEYASISVIANSIGAYFAMLALQNSNVEKAFFISPILNIEKLILDMMVQANVTEKILKNSKRLKPILEKRFRGII